MPPFETMDRDQKAVYWEYDSVDNVNESVFLTPVEVMVRWVNKERQVSGPQGNPVTTLVDVVSDQDLGIGSLLWLAPDQSSTSSTALDQWYGESGSAGNTERLMEVATVDITPSLKAEFTRYVHGLGFYKRTVVNE